MCIKKMKFLFILKDNNEFLKNQGVQQVSGLSPNYFNICWRYFTELDEIK
jgi:hypothetical protein